MSRKKLEAEQVVVTSTTPPADRGFYKKSRTAHGHVGDLIRRDPATGQESTFAHVTELTATQLATYTGRTGEVVEVTDLPGRPQYRWGGSQFAAVVTATPDATGRVGLAVSGLDVAVWGARAKTALVAGDSITAIAESSLGITSVTDNGDGTATVVRTSHSLGVGDPIRITAAPTQALCVMDSAVTTVVDANTIKCTLGGRTHGVTSPSGASLYFPYRRGCRGWFNWMESSLGETFRTTWCAVGGATAAQISALVDATTITARADVGFVCIGMNDVYSAGSSFATAQADIKALIAKVRVKSERLVLLTIPPRNSADGAWSAGKQAIHTALNRWLYSYGNEIGAVVVDTWRATQNGATYVNAAASNPDPDAAFVIDNTHPSMRGAIAIGSAVATALAGVLGTSGWKAAHPAAIGADAGNLLTGSDFATGATVATGWASSDSTANMSVAPTLAARTVSADGDACGRNQILTVAYGTATGTASTRFRRNDIHALLTPGTTVQLRVPFSISGATGLVGLELAMFGAVGSNFWLVFGQQQDSNADVVSGDFSGWLITPPAVVPSGLTDLDVWVRPYITSAQSGNMVLKVWQPELRVLA